MAASWVRDTTKLECDNIKIHAGSLAEAWQAISTKYLLQSVLVTSDRTSKRIPFNYESAGCTVKHLYDALAATYGLDWIQDKHTGVAWLHPVELAYDRILRTKIDAARDNLGLPMQSGILEPLGADNATNIKVKQWGSLFLNTFNCAVDVPAGTYAIRDLLNLCCVANPTKTFLAQARHDEVLLTATNLVPDKMTKIPAGALHLWDIETEQGRGKDAPTRDQVMTALADRKAEVRRAARNYLEAIIWNINADEWAEHVSTSAQTLWTCIGITSVLVRSEEATHPASIKTMERLATDDFLAKCEPGLALITALDLARLTKSDRALKMVKERKLGARELAGVTSDACRIANLSVYVRNALQSKSADSLPGIMAPLATIVRSPIAGKLDFRLAAAR